MKNLIIKFISLFQRIVNFFYFNFFANIKTSIKLNEIQSLRLNANLISDKIIWVSGMDKSGTTLLKNMLDKHPNIVCKSSGQFYNYYDDKTNWFQVKGGYDIIKKNIIESNWFKLHGEIWLNEDSIDNFIKILINDSFKSNISKDVKYISDKSVTQNFEKIKTNFPNSKYIAIIRDGRDVAVSLAFHYERNNKNSKFNKNKLLKDEFPYIVLHGPATHGAARQPVSARQTRRRLLLSASPARLRPVGGLRARSPMAGACPR